MSDKIFFDNMPAADIDALLLSLFSALVNSKLPMWDGDSFVDSPIDANTSQVNIRKKLTIGDNASLLLANAGASIAANEGINDNLVFQAKGAGYTSFGFYDGTGGHKFYDGAQNEIVIIDSNGVKLSNIPIFADNAAAVTGGLAADNVYKTTTGELRIVV